MSQFLKKHRIGGLLALPLALGLTACDALLSVDNPNNVAQEDLEKPASAPALVNGTASLLQNWDAAFQRSHALLSDESIWIGSLNDRGDLDFGNISFRSSDVGDAYSTLARLRWMADESVGLIEGFNTAGTLSNRLLLARAYFLAGMAYGRIAEHFEDFVLSDRKNAAPPIGAANMGQVWAKSIEYHDKALTVATALNNLDLRREILASRARTKHARAVGAVLKALPTQTPLVNDAGAVADAEAFLATNPPGAWTFQWNFSSELGSNAFASDMNNRLEQRISNVYIVPTADNRRVGSVRFQDPITGAVDPVVKGTIDAWIVTATRDFGPHVVTSAREMRLILAEAALARGDQAAFTTQINAIRTLNSLPAYSGQIPAVEMLKHTRQSSLFFMTRRLHDQYRFGVPSAEWIPTAQVRVSPGKLFPIGYTETVTNCYILGSC